MINILLDNVIGDNVIKDIVSDKVIYDKVIYDIVPVQAENWTKYFLTHKKTRTRGDVQMMSDKFFRFYPQIR